ncbi:AIG2-like protein isoform X1 [Cucumis melo var. makuwa]|uniref:Putative gamma-glutamylcyclotransferase n=1 Tax=Cucumis melo var. makuwa TaxID=1194695 RepID=A0A5D3E5V2_CUCMM|nr:AIG2-like protein isoform X1 [Cucumis melo var. makuwa]
MDSASLAARASLHPQQNLHSVFVYGSLMADEVLRILLKRTPQSSDAVLNGYQRLSVKGRLYPAIIPVTSKKVSGKIISGIKDSEMYLLDAYEDFEYKRITVEVSLMDSLEKLLVYAYVWGNEKDPNLGALTVRYIPFGFVGWGYLFASTEIEPTIPFPLSVTVLSVVPPLLHIVSIGDRSERLSTFPSIDACLLLISLN